MHKFFSPVKQKETKSILQTPDVGHTPKIEGKTTEIIDTPKKQMDVTETEQSKETNNSDLDAEITSAKAKIDEKIQEINTQLQYKESDLNLTNSEETETLIKLFRVSEIKDPEIFDEKFISLLCRLVQDSVLPLDDLVDHVFKVLYGVSAKTISTTPATISAAAAADVPPSASEHSAVPAKMYKPEVLKTQITRIAKLAEYGKDIYCKRIWEVTLVRNFPKELRNQITERRQQRKAMTSNIAKLVSEIQQEKKKLAKFEKALEKQRKEEEKQQQKIEKEKEKQSKQAQKQQAKQSKDKLTATPVKSAAGTLNKYIVQKLEPKQESDTRKRAPLTRVDDSVVLSAAEIDTLLSTGGYDDAELRKQHIAFCKQQKANLISKCKARLSALQQRVQQQDLSSTSRKRLKKNCDKQQQQPEASTSAAIATVDQSNSGLLHAHIVPKMKLFMFHENLRPAWWGTFSKRSDSIKPRKPFGRDERQLQYDEDSDEEWEEEGEGESLSEEEKEDPEEDVDDEDLESEDDSDPSRKKSKFICGDDEIEYENDYENSNEDSADPFSILSTHPDDVRQDQALQAAKATVWKNTIKNNNEKKRKLNRADYKPIVVNQAEELACYRVFIVSEPIRAKLWALAMSDANIDDISNSTSDSSTPSASTSTVTCVVDSNTMNGIELKSEQLKDLISCIHGRDISKPDIAQELLKKHDTIAKAKIFRDLRRIAVKEKHDGDKCKKYYVTDFVLGAVLSPAERSELEQLVIQRKAATVTSDGSSSDHKTEVSENEMSTPKRRATKAKSTPKKASAKSLAAASTGGDTDSDHPPTTEATTPKKKTKAKARTPSKKAADEKMDNGTKRTASPSSAKPRARIAPKRIKVSQSGNTTDTDNVPDSAPSGEEIDSDCATTSARKRLLIDSIIKESAATSIVTAAATTTPVSTATATATTSTVAPAATAVSVPDATPVTTELKLVTESTPVVTDVAMEDASSVEVSPEVPPSTPAPESAQPAEDTTETTPTFTARKRKRRSIDGKQRAQIKKAKADDVEPETSNGRTENVSSTTDATDVVVEVVLPLPSPSPSPSKPKPATEQPKKSQSNIMSFFGGAAVKGKGNVDNKQ